MPRAKKTNRKNQFFVIEALDAGGSQTQTDLLAARLTKAKYHVHQYHFPQEDAATGRLIYDKFLLHLNRYPFSRREQALLYIQDFFSRADEMNALITARQAHVLVSDRYCTSTMAYQTIGLPPAERQKMMAWLQWLCWQGTPRLPKPTAVIFLDTPVSVSLQRLAGKQKDYFESKAKLTAIRDSYLKVAKAQKWHVLDSMAGKKQRTRQDLHHEIWQRVAPYLY